MAVLTIADKCFRGEEDFNTTTGLHWKESLIT